MALSNEAFSCTIDSVTIVDDSRPKRPIIFLPISSIHSLVFDNHLIIVC